MVLLPAGQLRAAAAARYGVAQATRAPIVARQLPGAHNDAAHEQVSGSQPAGLSSHENLRPGQPA